MTGRGPPLLLLLSLVLAAVLHGATADRWVWPRRIPFRQTTQGRTAPSSSSSSSPVGERRGSGFDSLFRQRSGSAAATASTAGSTGATSFRSFSDFLGYVNGAGATSISTKSTEKKVRSNFFSVHYSHPYNYFSISLRTGPISSAAGVHHFLIRSAVRALDSEASRHR